MAGLGALISSILNLVSNLLPEVNTTFCLSSSSSTQAPDACALEADLASLMRMLERIKATLFDADERNIRDQSVRLWLKELKELGHEAEYVLEEYMYEVYHAQIEARNASKLNLIKGDLKLDASDINSVPIPYGIVDRIRDIKCRFEEIANDREALRLREEDAPRRGQNDRRNIPTSPLLVEQSVFGREQEKEKVIVLLLLDNHPRDVVSVLPIVGKGGIGKTTLAQLVYSDKRVQDSFDMIGWVYVSDYFNLKRMTRAIIESLTREACYLKNPSVLMEELANRVRGKRIFLVLDDVWVEERRLWESLCVPLMFAIKATILVTTRNISVARIMQTMDPLQLAYLSDDKCWMLFTHYAFQGKDLSNQATLVQIGRKIVKKCSGLPLAVKSIASLLSHEEDLQIWMDILMNDLWESDARNEVMAALEISYERMPTYLKPCLLLCSMFPKNYRYSMNSMSRLWIAHGYIEPKGKKSIEEVAADYTRELYERSFFDDYNINYDDKHGLPIDCSFRLHDVVYELAWLNSEKTCCSVERGKQPVLSKGIRHLHLYKEISELPEVLCSINIPFIETLVMRFPWRSIYDKVEDDKQINLINSLSKAQNLRALDLNCTEINVLPFSLGRLKHLHYLSLCDDEFVAQISPQSIFSCYSLRILVLDIMNINMNLEGLGNLINLESLQLFMSSFYCKLPDSLGFLKKLRVLEIDGSKVYDRGYNTHLFMNFKCGKNFQLPECIGNLVELHRIVIIALPLQQLPDSFCNLTNLKDLILPNCILKELPEDFGNLTSLQILFLEGLHYLPQSCTRLIPSCTINVNNLIMHPENCHGAVGWLKEFNDIKGVLLIQDIQNITSIEDAKNANLISKLNLETLSLLWNKMDYLKTLWHERSYNRDFFEMILLEPEDYSVKNGKLGISIGYSENCKSLSGQDHDILEIFQPHSNLKHLKIDSYRGLEFPRWMGDPLSGAALTKLWIRNCPHISSVPLGKVLSLKYLYIVNCAKLFHLKRESLPSQLKYLVIRECNSLIEIALLESLVELHVTTCDKLKTLSTIHLNMPETTLDSSGFTTDYCHLKSSKELKRFPSLKKMTIRECRNLVIGMNQLKLAEDCEVSICY